jgi:hypothetical protein
MSEFSSMGVDLNARLKCGDEEGYKMFYLAKAKYTEVYTLAEVYNLTERYRNFFFRNGRSSYWACKEKSIEVGGINN